ncbi:hypothetical protein DM01DRAFT_1333648 [Hesseltinella vesiculosa]|uniref:Uncharacterized protein n=1 Tax=Hesseltinella vesiculosa TaxID=101127 RepID=A0A1X2GNI2_9FUNG|nr:hypothetical protein DM01DRAFT_1333648 [Hesseltinella vesiculosa]
MSNAQNFSDALNKKLQGAMDKKPTVKPFDGTGMLSPTNTEATFSDDDANTTATDSTLKTNTATQIGMVQPASTLSPRKTSRCSRSCSGQRY